MIKQAKAKSIICTIVVIMIILVLNEKFNISFATNDASNYVFEPKILLGPNMSMVKKGSNVNEMFDLWNKSTKQFEEFDIDPSKISVNVSNPKLVSIENNIIKAEEEGEITVKYTHIYNNMNFEFERTYYIYDKEFSNVTAPIISNSSLELEIGKESKNIKAGVNILDSAAYAYDVINYNYQWKIEDESIAKIEENSINDDIWKSNVKVTPLKPGKTKIICIVSTEDGKESITKAINITVTSESNNYYFGPMILDGPNMSMVEKGNTINRGFDLVNLSTMEYIDIDQNKISFEVSDPNLVEIKNNIITAKEEGKITVKYKYNYNNMNFEYEGTYFIYEGRFSNVTAPIISNSSLELEIGKESKNIKAGVNILGSAAYAYDVINYNYQWKIEDESIAKIEENSINDDDIWKSNVKVTPLKPGKTKIICIVTTEDGKESITKIINVTVTGDSNQNPNSNPTPTPKQQQSNKEDNTISKKGLPNTGKGKIAFLILLVLSIGAYIFYYKSKIK